MFKWLFGPTRQDALAANAQAAAADPTFSLELEGLIETLEKALEPQDRGFTAQRIGARGKAAAKAIPALLNVLQNDKGADARAGAAGALGDIEVGTTEVVGALIKAIQQDTEADVRLNAIISLGQLGPNAKTAIPLLKKVESDSNESKEIRFRAGVNARILEQE